MSFNKNIMKINYFNKLLKLLLKRKYHAPVSALLAL